MEETKETKEVKEEKNGKKESRSTIGKKDKKGRKNKKEEERKGPFILEPRLNSLYLPDIPSPVMEFLVSPVHLHRVRS